MISKLQLHWFAKRKRVTPKAQQKLAKILQPGDVVVTRHDNASTNLFCRVFGRTLRFILVLDNSFFEVVSIYGFKGKRFAMNHRAKQLLEASYSKKTTGTAQTNVNDYNN